MTDPRTDLVRVAQSLVRETTIYPQGNGALIVVIPYAIYAQLDDTLATIAALERADRAAKAQAPAPTRPAAEPAPHLP